MTTHQHKKTPEALSPAAQKIINTFPADNEEDLLVIASAFARVIRIVTDEITEYRDEPTPENTPKGVDFGYAWAVWHKNASIRQRLLLLLTMRTNASEKAYLQKVAAERSTTVSDLIRNALRREGALPAH